MDYTIRKQQKNDVFALIEAGLEPKHNSTHSTLQWVKATSV